MRFLVIAALLCSSTAALAADLPNVKAPPVYAPPPFTWSGFYIGANGGYGWTQGSSGTVFITPPGSSSIPYAGNSVNSNGAIAGGQLGYNWQFGSLVLGGEGDFDWTGIKGSTVPDPQNGPVASLLTAKQNWLATVRGRVGYAIGQVLLYATGGVGFTEANITDTRLIYSNDTLRSGSATQVGGVVGAGAEWAFAESEREARIFARLVRRPDLSPQLSLVLMRRSMSARASTRIPISSGRASTTGFETGVGRLCSCL